MTKTPCDLGDGEFDHDWKFIDDWYGDPGIINGTADCGYWECRVCGEVDNDREPPQHGDWMIDFDYG